MKQFISILLIIGLAIFYLSCSEDDLGDFQQNDPEPEYRFFTLLDDYPALRSAFNSVDSYKFNDLMCEAMNDIPGDVKAVLEVVEDMLLNKRTNTIESAREILYRILNQDELDRDPIFKTNDPGYETKDFPYYDRISEFIDPATDQKINFTKPILAMQRKMFGYLKYRFSDEELEEVVADFIAYLRDDDANMMKVLIEEVLAKLFLQGNENLWYRDARSEEDKEKGMKFDTGDSLCGRDDIGKEGTVDSRLGNAVRGVDTALSGQEDLMNDPEYRETFYEFLREAGKMMTATVKESGEEKNYSTVLKEFICNVEKYFTQGGEIYESDPHGTGGPNNDYQRGYVYEEDGEVKVEGALNLDIMKQSGEEGREEYVSAELGNTLRDMFAVIPSLWIRSDKIHSAAYYNSEKGRAKIFDLMTRYFEILGDMGFDPDTAHLEERMYDLVRFDAWGRDRLKNMTDEDASLRPFPSSYMNHMMLQIAIQENYGWWDAALKMTAEEMGDFYDFNFGHGPLESSGYFTMNDALFHLGFNEPAVFGIGTGMNMFELAIKGSDWDAQHSFRSVVPFIATQALDYQFRSNTEANVISFMPTAIAGDAGVPFGGNPYGWDGNPDGVPPDDPAEAAPLNLYRPYSSDGRGEPDLINMFLTSFVRFIWDGQGPFYSREGMLVEGNEYTFYRADRSINMIVTKPDPDKPIGDIVNENDPYCFEKDDNDVKMIMDARDNDLVKSNVPAEYLDDLGDAIEGCVDVNGEECDVSDDSYIENIVRYIENNSPRDIAEFYEYFHKYQQTDDWFYFYPVSRPDDDEPYLEHEWDFRADRAGQRKNCRYEQKVQTDYMMMHLDDVLMFYDKDLLERDINNDGEIEDFIDETGEYIDEPDTLVIEKLPRFQSYDIYSVPNEEIGIYGDVTGERQPMDKIMVAADPDDRIKWEREQLENFKAGRMTMYELIPEKTKERECETHLEALYRNLLFYTTYKKFAMGIPIYMAISTSDILSACGSAIWGDGVLDWNWKNVVIPMIEGMYPELSKKASQSASVMLGEGNGSFGLGTQSYIEFTKEEMGPYPNVNGKWRVKRQYSEEYGQDIVAMGQSFIPGDNRMYMMYVADDMMNVQGILMNDLFEGNYGQLLDKVWKFFIDITTETTSFTMAELREGFASWQINHMLGRGEMIGGACASSSPCLGRMIFPRCVDPRDPSKQISIVGPCTGELLKDRDWKCVIKSDEINLHWGFEVSDDDPNWPNRNSIFVEAFLAFQIALREAGGEFYETLDEFMSKKGAFDPQAPSNDFNPSKAFLDIVLGAMSNPLVYYIPDTEYPRKTWMGRLVNNHCMLKRADLLDDGRDEDGAWNEDNTGHSLWEPREPYEFLQDWRDLPKWEKHDSFEERSYYLPANVVNLISVQCDSDPFGDFHDEPKRCDGMIPLMTEYDVYKPVGPDNPPNTRLLTKIFKLGMALSAKKFNDPPKDSEGNPVKYDEDDYTTWSTRQKLRYGTEQLVTVMRCRKGDRVKINESNLQRSMFWPEVYTYPDWMFSDNGIRPEDINLDKIIEELIGSDESGKGLAIIPDNRPNPEDWKNIDLFFEAQAELMSDNGKTKGRYNIIEDLIELIDLINTPDASNEMLKGLRHTIGSVFTRYNKETEKWEYPGELVHIMTKIVPDMMETFKGRYRSLCNVTEAMLKEDGFLEWFIYTLDSDNSGREIFEQLHEFLGEDFIANHDSSFWEDYAGLMTGMASLINTESNANEEWVKDDVFNSNDDVLKSAQPFEAMGELFSW